MKTSARAALAPKSLVVPTASRSCCGPASAACDASSGRTRIVLIDDDWGALSHLREIIEQQADLEVVAACRCAEGAMLAVRQYRPAIIVLDVRRDGFELVRDITATSETKVIVFTAA